MTTLQAMLFGAMLAWTPSLILMVLILRHEQYLSEEEAE
jgi:hypothetical protein